MDILQNNAMTQRIAWKNTGQTCPLCEDDPTATEKMKSTKHSGAVKLEQHMTTGVAHAPLGRWRRMHEQIAKECKFIALLFVSHLR